MSNPVVILGTSGFAMELHALLQAAGRPVAGFIGPVGDVTLPGLHLGGDDALSGVDSAAEVLVAVGSPALRQKLADMALGKGRRLATFISPDAFVATDAVIGAGAMIYPNATVHARVRLGRGVLVNSNASIGHETEIDDYGTVGPGVSLGGRCRIGAGAYLGIGCSVIEQLRIAPGAMIGAGAVVIKDIDAAGTYVGVPARQV